MSVLPSALLLDFDGVIADTEHLHLRAFQHVLEGCGIEVTAGEYFARYLGRNDRDVILSAASDAGVSLPGPRLEAMLKDKAAQYARTIATRPVLYDGVERRVREWSREVPLAIVSGSLRGEIETILGRHALLECFSAIVAAGEVAHGKPAPDGYLAALHALHDRRVVTGRRTPGSLRRHERIEPGRCVVIEDSLPGLQAARAAGMRAVAVTTNHPASLLATADLVVANLAALDLPRLGQIARGGL